MTSSIDDIDYMGPGEARAVLMALIEYVELAGSDEEEPTQRDRLALFAFVLRSGAHALDAGKSLASGLGALDALGALEESPADPGPGNR
jgi:hypothetical protein